MIITKNTDTLIAALNKDDKHVFVHGSFNEVRKAIKEIKIECLSMNRTKIDFGWYMHLCHATAFDSVIWVVDMDCGMFNDDNVHILKKMSAQKVIQHILTPEDYEFMNTSTTIPSQETCNHFIKNGVMTIPLDGFKFVYVTKVSPRDFALGQSYWRSVRALYDRSIFVQF
jgi:hypothetical protein